MSEKIRINRFLASTGFCSRRKCEELIKQGVVVVNGEKVEKLSLMIDVEKDSVTVHGRPVKWNRKTVVLALNKPTGVLSTVTDDFGRRTVIELAKENGYMERMFPVGRLDLETSGILILTNDGDLAFRLIHPRFEIEKTYNLVVEGEISDETVAGIASGIKKGEFVTRPCKVKVIKREAGRSELEVKLKEGRKRQIRKMFSLSGHKVIKLHRAALGDLRFEDLKIGDIRPLSPEEEYKLRELTGLA